MMTNFAKIHVTFFLTICLLAYMTACYFFMERLPALIHWAGYLIFAYGVTTWKLKMDSKWFSPYSIFFLFFVLFNYGQPLMWALNIHQEREIGAGPLFYVSGYTPTRQDLIATEWYVCLGMLAFHFGALFFARNNAALMEKMVLAAPSEEKIEAAYIAMRKIGGAILFLLTPIALYSKCRDVAIARAHGYSALYYGENATQGGYLQIVMFLFFPAMVAYLIGSRYSKRAQRIVYGIFGAYATLGILSGDRGGWIYSLVILVWLHGVYNKVSWRKYAIYLTVGFIGVHLLSVVTAARNAGFVITGEAIEEAFLGERSPIVGAIYEMGGSMGIITYFLNRGEGIYPYGNTYLTSILGVVSARALSLFGLKQAALSGWFSQDYLGINWGTGFSMLGEAFVNGGYYGGLLYMFVIGVLIGKLLQFASNTLLATTAPLKFFISVAGLNVVVGFARNHSFLVLKNLLYGVGLIVFAVWYVTRKRR